MRLPLPGPLFLPLIAALLSCGGSPRHASPSKAAGERRPDAREVAATDLDFRIAEAVYAESIGPVEKNMCRADVPDQACTEVCRATDELRDVSSRICGVGGVEDDPARHRKCRESRALAKRAETTCSFCAGSMTRRPCPDLF